MEFPSIRFTFTTMIICRHVSDIVVGCPHTRCLAPWINHLLCMVVLFWATLFLMNCTLSSICWRMAIVCVFIDIPNIYIYYYLSILVCFIYIVFSLLEYILSWFKHFLLPFPIHADLTICSNDTLFQKYVSTQTYGDGWNRLSWRQRSIYLTKLLTLDTAASLATGRITTSAAMLLTLFS